MDISYDLFISFHVFVYICEESVKSLGMFDFGAANSTLVLIVHDL